MAPRGWEGSTFRRSTSGRWLLHGKRGSTLTVKGRNLVNSRKEGQRPMAGRYVWQTSERGLKKGKRPQREKSLMILEIKSAEDRGEGGPFTCLNLVTKL
ncbi:hypothetical protein KP509_05G083700 [Ceratopteris richardii]|uniref:Uncharacterized protein n=1 Tax=Ceratopteris richardii TaxID=49495 RepID=A0A8T2USE2_CERRI|nr:hypothetical protein KP509_05G083700 [Ceratopteris richardii]